MKNYSRFINSLFGLLVFCVLLSGLTACEKNVNEEEDKHTYFFKRFGNEADEAAVFINQCSGNKIHVASYVGTVKEEFIGIYDYSDYGTILQSNLQKSVYCAPIGYPMNDGTFFVGELFINQLTKYNAEGTEVARYQNTGNMDYFHGTPIELPNKHIVFALSNGSGATDSRNFIYELKENMDFYSIRQVDESDAKGHIIRFEVDRIEGDDYYCSGSMIPSPWQFSDKHRTFVARFNFVNPANNFVKIVPSLDVTKNDNMVAKANLQDGGLLQLISPGFFLLTARANSGGKAFELVRWDKNRNLLWKNRFGLGFNITSPTRVTVNEKGEYIVVGGVKNGAMDPYFPFLIKIDANGNEIFHKVYYEIFNGAFNYGYQVENGDLFFAGTIELFGEKVHANDGFILKTDANGNY